MLTGKQQGPRTGAAAGFETFEEVVDAFRAQTAYFVGKMAESLNIIEENVAKYTPHIYCSLLLDDCMASRPYL